MITAIKGRKGLASTTEKNAGVLLFDCIGQSYKKQKPFFLSSCACFTVCIASQPQRRVVSMRAPNCVKNVHAFTARKKRTVDEYGQRNPTKSKIRRKKPLEFDRRDLARSKSKVAQRTIFLDCFGVF